MSSEQQPPGYDDGLGIRTGDYLAYSKIAMYHDIMLYCKDMRCVFWYV